MTCPAFRLLPNQLAAPTVVPCEGTLAVETLICLLLRPPLVTDFFALKQDRCDAFGHWVLFQ